MDTVDKWPADMTAAARSCHRPHHSRAPPRVPPPPPGPASFGCAVPSIRSPTPSSVRPLSSWHPKGMPLPWTFGNGDLDNSGHLDNRRSVRLFDGRWTVLDGLDGRTLSKVVQTTPTPADLRLSRMRRVVQPMAWTTLDSPRSVRVFGVICAVDFTVSPHRRPGPWTRRGPWVRTSTCPPAPRRRDARRPATATTPRRRERRGPRPVCGRRSWACRR